MALPINIAPEASTDGIGMHPNHDSRSGLVTYGLRKGGRLWIIDREGYTLWATAQRGLDPSTLISEWSHQVQGDHDAGEQLLSEFLRAELLMDFTEDAEHDWNKIARLRVVPRALAAGYAQGPPDTYVIMSPDGGHGVRIDPLSFALYSYWDGAMTVEASVDTVVHTHGVSPRLVRERSAALVVGAMRAGIIFLDIGYRSSSNV